MAGAGFERVGTNSQAVTVCAGGSTVNGVDVSTYQGSVDWTSVHAAGIDFAFTARERRDDDSRRNVRDELGGHQGGRHGARGIPVLPRLGGPDSAGRSSSRAARGRSARRPPRSPTSRRSTASRGRRSSRTSPRGSREIKSKTGRTPMIYASTRLLGRPAEHLPVRERALVGRQLGRQLPRHVDALDHLDVLAVRRQRLGLRHLRRG